MHKHSYKIVTAFLLAGSLLSCSKEADITPDKSTPVADRKSSHDIAANYAFDWETATKMPVSSNSSTDVFMPWRSQGGTPIDPGIINDYKKADGWELVYNSFCPDNFPNVGDRGTMPTVTQQPSGGLYFALYNRYRGLLRYYMYIPPGNFGSSTQLSHGLRLYSSSNTSKMLNFEGRDIVDVDNNTDGFTETSKDGVPATGGWYAMQYQLAYDPAFANTTFPNPGFRWDVNSLSVTALEMNGVETGTIKGTAVTPQSGFNWANALVNIGLSGIEIVSSFGLSSLADNAGGLQRALNSGTSGSTAGYLSGLFGSSSGGSQTIDLTMSSQIKTTGTANTSQIYQTNSKAFPGQNMGASGVAPLISYPLGLFNLVQKPTVKRESKTVRSSVRGGDNEYSHLYTMNRSAIINSLRLNPAVFNSNSTTGATMTNLKIELVLLDAKPLWQVDAEREEIIGKLKANSSTEFVNLSYYGTSMYGGSAGTPVIRVSFTVQPNNGSPKTLVVKSFASNVQAQSL